MLTEKQVGELVPRLRRVEGQVRGIIRMIENRDYCISILDQATAVTGALRAAAGIILRNHIATCLREAVLAGDEQDIERKISELVLVMTRFNIEGGPGPAETTAAGAPPGCECRDPGGKRR